MVRRATASLLLRPWLDGAALRLITRVYFPLSRAWAAALAADGDAEAFLAALPRRAVARRLLPRPLALTASRKASLAEAEGRWEEAFFATGPATADAEASRLAAAQALMGLRSAFLPMHSIEPFPAVAWAVEPPAAVRHRHQGRLNSAQPFSGSADPATVEASRAFAGRRGIEGWIRFPSPVAAVGGHAWARVLAPYGRGVRGRSDGIASLVFCHGIGMEPEYWRSHRLGLGSFVEAGIRVLRPEAPWHGRRRPVGFYGGEPVLAGGPGALLDYFHAAVAELGTMIAWARATRGGPVALAGVSLGALTAQLVVTAAAAWPKSMRPDALLLIAPSISLARVTFEGSLTQALGVPQAVLDAGWTPNAIEAWRPLLEPVGEPVLDPDRIIVILGEADDVTLAEGGENLVALWRVPHENVFRFPAGHFTTSLALLRNGPSARRFRTLIDRLRN